MMHAMELKKTEAPSNPQATLLGCSQERREKNFHTRQHTASGFGIGEHYRCNYSSFEVVVLIASGRNYGGRLY
jgi:hypothetical protein